MAELTLFAGGFGDDGLESKGGGTQQGGGGGAGLDVVGGFADGGQRDVAQEHARFEFLEQRGTLRRKPHGFSAAYFNCVKTFRGCSLHVFSPDEVQSSSTGKSRSAGIDRISSTKAYRWQHNRDAALTKGRDRLPGLRVSSAARSVVKVMRSLPAEIACDFDCAGGPRHSHQEFF